jgi:hypothetical protein
MTKLTVIALSDAYYINTIFKQTSTPKPSSHGIFGKSLNPSVATNANDGATKIYVDPATPTKTLSVSSASTFG